MTIEWIRDKKPTVTGIIHASLDGLCGITPAAGFVGFTGAIIIGLIVGAICSYNELVQRKLGYDDPSS